MHWTDSSSGSLQMDHIITVALLSTCCLLVSQATADNTSPKIQRPKSPKIEAFLGKPLVIPCKADPGFTDDVTLIYWLVNRTFIEHAHPNGRIRVGQEEAEKEGGKRFIRRDLVFQKVAREDFEATYICVVSNAAGIDRKELRLKRVSQNYIKGKKWKHAGEEVKRLSGVVEDTS